MKSLQKGVLALYIILLLWLVLFKFSFEIFFIIAEHQERSFNTIFFAGPLREMIDNFIVFVPFGLLLCVNFTRITFLQKLAIIFSFSLGIEIVQYVLAIGITDLSDIAMNTLGGLAGLVAYTLANKYIATQKLNIFITVVGIGIAIVFLLFRFFVLKVQY